MKVTIKSIPVRYDDKSYRVGDTLTIKDEHFDKDIFKEVKEPAKNKAEK
jgi:hypothetical protein